MDIVAGFEVEQADYFVAWGEALVVLKFVLEDALVKIATEPDVQSACDASHHVDAVVAAVAHEGMIERSGRRGCDGCHNAGTTSGFADGGRDASTPQ